MKKQITAIFIMCTVLLAGAAQAGDKKVLPGATCEWDNATNTPKKNAFSFWNETSGNKLVVCPIVRDTNNNMNYVYLNVNGPLPSAPLIYARAENGGTFSSTPSARYTNLGDGRGRYEWDEFSAPNNAALGISVNLGVDGRIYTYRWDE